MTDTFKLNEKQEEAFSLVRKNLNVLITGSAGTGKSATLSVIVDYLKETDKKYGLTAMTGCAATFINARTLHSFLGIGLAKESVDKLVKKIKRKATFKIIKELETLIIDEISMMSDTLFNKISEIFSIIKNNKSPFGGVQLVLVGDFCQLPPIEGDYCFTSEIWEKCEIKTLILTELIRQKDDVLFQQILQIVRKGKCLKNMYSVLEKLSDTKFDNDIIPTKLFPKNINVDQINSEEFDKLLQVNKDFKIYPASSTKKINNLDEYHVKLTNNAQIMVTRNISVEDNLVNGTRGIVVELLDKHLVIKDINNNLHVITYHKDIDENDENLYILFMPIKLAYALSIHKAQGMTIDALEIDIGTNIFEYGQLYTALSRAKSLKSIKIVAIHKDSFMINPKVKKFYNI